MIKYLLQPTPKPGDLIGFAGMSSLSRWISYGTLCWPGSGLVHIGTCTRSPLDNDNGLTIFESTTMIARPCLYAGQVVFGAQFQPLGERVFMAKSSVWLYRLRHSLTDEESQELTALCIADAGKNYDYWGAIRARKIAFGWLLRRMKPRREDLDQLFCSEVSAVRLRDLNRWDPGNASEWDPHSMGRSIVKDGVTEKRVRLTSTLVQGA